MSNELEALKIRLQEFAKERDWDQFHSPKNFSMALIVECAELVEHFQWLTDEQSKRLPADTLEEVSLEMADIMIYLICCICNNHIFTGKNKKNRMNVMMRCNMSSLDLIYFPYYFTN